MTYEELTRKLADTSPETMKALESTKYMIFIDGELIKITAADIARFCKKQVVNNFQDPEIYVSKDLQSPVTEKNEEMKCTQICDLAIIHKIL